MARAIARITTRSATGSIAGVILLGILCLPCILSAQKSPSALLLVLSKQDNTLAIVDAADLRILAKVPVGNDPHEVIASADGTTAYVSNYGYGAYNTLAVVDLTAYKALPSIDLGPLRGPHGLAFARGKTWFTAEGAKAIARYDPATHKVDWILGTGQDRTHMIDVSADAREIVTTNVASGTVDIIEEEPVRPPTPPPARRGIAPPPGGGGQWTLRTDWNATVIRVGSGSEGFDLSPDRKEIWVANAGDGTISIIDFPAKKVIETLAANVLSANRLKFTPDGKRVLVSMLDGPDVAVFDAHTRREVKRIPVGHGAAGILIEPDGSRAFVACTPDDYVAVIDLHSLQIVGHLRAGGRPDGMAWTEARR